MNGCANEKITLNFTTGSEAEECFQMQNCLVDNGQEMISSSLLYSRDKVHFPKVIIIKYFSTMRHDVTQWLKIMVISHIIKKFEFSVLNSNFWEFFAIFGRENSSETFSWNF